MQFCNVLQLNKLLAVLYASGALTVFLLSFLRVHLGILHFAVCHVCHVEKGVRSGVWCLWCLC